LLLRFAPRRSAGGGYRQLIGFSARIRQNKDLLNKDLLKG